MSASNYTGIGISCGSGLCNVCLAVLSVPVINFAVPKAGDFIDMQAAAVTGELATRMRVQKELNFVVNGLSGDRVQNALTVYYDDVIQTLRIPCGPRFPPPSVCPSSINRCRSYSAAERRFRRAS